MSACPVQASGAPELYFYNELPEAQRESFEGHSTGCDDCRRALEELAVIRAALEACPVVSAPAGGDWSALMTRLQRAVEGERAPQPLAEGRGVASGSQAVMAVFAMAALVVLVTWGVFAGLRHRSESGAGGGVETRTTGLSTSPLAERPGQARSDEALAQMSEQHFERSKLVVLGLATKDPADSTAESWDYERTLATSLLSDTRLYRQAAEERGMHTLAEVMSDLELVLLQTSMSEAPDAESLAQLQRLIRRRDLITKMNVVAPAGLAP